MSQGPLVVNIEEYAQINQNFRQVLTTLPHMQIVLMALKPGEEIGLEVHPDTDQFLRIEVGEGMAVVGSDNYRIFPGVSVHVPQGTYHNIMNQSTSMMKLYTIYSPPHHPHGLVQKDRPLND